MTVDHLKMLHTAGGKGEVLYLTVGCLEKGARSLGCGVQCAVVGLGDSEWEVSCVSSGVWDLLPLDKSCGIASIEVFCSASSRSF